jgi:N-acetylmuramoyl-L-alanine amidase
MLIEVRQRLRLTAACQISYPRLMLVLVILMGTLPARPVDEKHLTVYSTSTSYSLSVDERDGREYVGVLGLLEPLGSVSTRTDGLHWKIRFNGLETEFTQRKTRAKMRGRDVDLVGPFILENGQGLIPLASLNTILPPLLGVAVTFNDSSRRLFLGGVSTHFTAQLAHTGPTRLVMNFTAPVNPSIATEPGGLRMIFRREPVVSPSTPTLTFGDKAIPSATFTEDNGLAEITVSGGVPLTAAFSHDGRTITVSPVSQPAAQSQTPTPAPVPPSPASPAPAGGPAQTSAGVAPTQRTYFAVVDASHGGDDRGVALSDQLAEKDVTLAIARRLRQELETRGISALVLRDSDANLSLDQRAILANTSHPALYVSIHAASDGKGVRVYTAMLPAGGDNNGPFIAWDVAQTQFLPASLTAASGIASQMQRRQIPVRTFMAPLRPLNNITAAAVAVEVAPPGSDINDLKSPIYQQTIAATVADGVLTVREKLGAGR